MKHYAKNKIINKGKFFQATMTILLKSHLALAEPDCHLKISGLVAIKHETFTNGVVNHWHCSKTYKRAVLCDNYGH